MINRMWNDAFEYKTDEEHSYTMWWFEGGRAGTADARANPNDLITVANNLSVPDQCHLSYFHKEARHRRPNRRTEYNSPSNPN